MTAEEGFMDEDTGQAEKANTIQTEKVDPAAFMNSARFAQSKDLNEGVAATPEAPVPGYSVAAAPADNGPPLPGGRGSHDALTEAVMAAGRAIVATEGPTPTPLAPVAPQSLQEFQEAPRQTQNRPYETRKVITEDCRPPLKRKVSSPSAVIEGDIVEHKDTGALGKVVESTKRGMKIKLSGVGLVEVKPKEARNYKLVGRRV
jgi:hypothetical protein